MYYRVAIRREGDQRDRPPSWQWRSTVLSSLHTLFQFLRLYAALPQDRLRVFSSSREPRTFKVTPAEKGGSYLQFETSHAPGTKTPAHFHQQEDEAFYVLAGQYEFLVGETRFTATTGAFAFAPRGTIHAFTNSGQEVGRMLITVTPGTQHEGFLREVSALTEQLAKPPETSQLVTLTLKYGWVWLQATNPDH